MTARELAVYRAKSRGITDVSVLTGEAPVVVAGWSGRIYWGFAVLLRDARTHLSRKWRNWQTHQLEGLAIAISWGFESPLPHQKP